MQTKQNVCFLFKYCAFHTSLAGAYQAWYSDLAEALQCPQEQHTPPGAHHLSLMVPTP